ncbi:MAG TPA: cation:dicarboxylase symporter family transporter [Candidatus Acidoferrales bacterium]|nr:cation:dicarboxylase symporter family transporter [Candidatus Acidoferrales bacterium]
MAETNKGHGKKRKPGAYFGIPLPVWVIAFLGCGLLIGVFFPGNRVAAALYMSGTYFPKAVVTFATLVIFALLSGATAKLVLFHRQGAGRLFGLILAAYVALGCASLVYVTIWIPILTKLPLSSPGAATLGPGQWVQQLVQSFSTLFSEQPLMQVLIVAVVIGYGAAAIPILRPVAHGLVKGSEATLWLFKKLLWYYPLMIGCLAIGIPLRFGLHGMAAYGQTTLWVGLITVSWSVILAVAVRLATKRSFKQIASYYASVWPTGFGTGGSYETLAMNVVSAESDLGLPREIAGVSIVFGTVMNKSCATMSVMLVTISVARLLNFPISLTEIVTLIPPVLILGLESPGIPGGAAFFMSPIVAALLHVHDPNRFVATFITMYSGLIPMFSTAGNTTNDGLVGALLNDRFSGYLKLRESAGFKTSEGPASPADQGQPRGLRLATGWILMALAAWMLVSPQALLGLDQLKWIHNYAFPGEAVLGALVMTISLYVLTPEGRLDVMGQAVKENLPEPEPSRTTTHLT